MMNFFKKPKLKPGIRQREFSCIREGLTIRGTEYRPAGENLPIALVCHGFMAWQDTVRHYAVRLAELGYAAYCFDFNGGSVMKSRSDGKTTEMSVLTEVRDLEAVLDHVRQLPYLDRDRIFLMGCSQGGFVSALTAARERYPIDKLCLFYPAFCIPDDARAGKMMMSRFDPGDLPETLRCGPMKLGRCYAADVMDLHPFQMIGAYSGQVCIVHGTADRIVDISYAQRAAESYRAALPDGMTPEQRVQLHIIPGGGHMFSEKHDRIALTLLEDFAGKE